MEVKSQLNMSNKDENTPEKEYEEKVKSYTGYVIGQKISKNVPKMTEDEIQSQSMQISSSSILRIMIKWCEELEEKFSDPDYFLERDEGFLMVNGKEAEMNTMHREYLAHNAQI